MGDVLSWVENWSAEASRPFQQFEAAILSLSVPSKLPFHLVIIHHWFRFILRMCMTLMSERCRSIVGLLQYSQQLRFHVVIHICFDFWWI